VAGTGNSADSADLDGAVQADMRRQALKWLRDVLALEEKKIASRNPLACAQARSRMWMWQHEPDLAHVRDSGELLSLPTEEREQWLALWNDVDGLMKQP
jgi:hypothetical protein